VNAHTLIKPAVGGGLARISFGGGGEPTHIVCGFLGSEERHNSLIATLPRLLKLDVNDVISRDWVEASVKFAARELAEGRFGSSSVMSRLSELLFVEAVRSHASKADIADRQLGAIERTRSRGSALRAKAGASGSGCI
jgi:Cupin